MRLAHVSDLHMTGMYFVEGWFRSLKGLLEDIEPDLLIISGDLTDDGHLYEYERAYELVGELPVERKLIVPGNHDSRNMGYSLFEELFGTRYPTVEVDGVKVLGMDSTEPDINDGHVGRENYPLIERELRGGRVKILTLHHHLIPIPGTGRERNIPVDAGDVLKKVTEERVNFVLSGHRHLPWIWKLERTYFINAGTATSKRLKGRSYPSFNLLEIEDNTFRLHEYNVINGKSKEILTGEINPPGE
ncbi:MAG: metallophosphoesterase [Thermoplasmata archaeon]|nr:MAG: metallophosphoesterase [Thermoplasmata archaeon]RLF70455.1 MAG: metallophosphoesterase [Thermoplasmata archaeon]RLF73528.1 MAG: metallophosphoesterase [Thermoplasmata archaeon]